MRDLEFIRRSPGIAPEIPGSGVRSHWSEAPFPRAMARMMVVKQTPSNYGCFAVFASLAFAKTQTSADGLQHPNLRFGWRGEHDIVDIPNINTSTKSTVARNNN